MSNATQFKIELGKWFEDEVEGVVEDVTRGTGQRALDKLVHRSRVKTGRFRGNWTVSVDVPDFTHTENVDPTGGATIAKGKAIIDAVRGPRVIYVQNNLPYAEKMEDLDRLVALTVAELEMMFK